MNFWWPSLPFWLIDRDSFFFFLNTVALDLFDYTGIDAVWLWFIPPMMNLQFWGARTCCLWLILNAWYACWCYVWVALDLFDYTGIDALNLSWVWCLELLLPSDVYAEGLVLSCLCTFFDVSVCWFYARWCVYWGLLGLKCYGFELVSVLAVGMVFDKGSTGLYLSMAFEVMEAGWMPSRFYQVFSWFIRFEG